MTVKLTKTYISSYIIAEMNATYESLYVNVYNEKTLIKKSLRYYNMWLD